MTGAARNAGHFMGASRLDPAQDPPESAFCGNRPRASATLRICASMSLSTASRLAPFRNQDRNPEAGPVAPLHLEEQ